MLPDDNTEHRNDDNNNKDSSVNKNVDCGSKKPFTQYFKIEVERRKKVLEKNNYQTEAVERFSVPTGIKTNPTFFTKV